MKIEIAKSEVITKSGISKRTGQPYTMYEQLAYLHQEGEPYPTPMKITLNKNDHGHPVPYAPGYYSLAPQSFYVDRFGGLACRPVLMSIASPARQPAPAPAAQRAS